MAKLARTPKKSGDSKLQDAETARQRNRMSGGKADPESLPEIVQDAVELKRASGATEEVLLQTQKALANLTTVMEGMQKKIALMEVSGGRKVNVRVNRLKCPTCRQVTMGPDGRGVCEGKHILVKVVPPEIDLWPKFQGISVNGQRYIGWSQVPPRLKSHILAECRRWAANHKSLFIKRGKVFGDWADTKTAGVGRTPIIDTTTKSFS